MKKFLKQIDIQDCQLVTGIVLLGYGLFLVYPPLCPITIGLLCIFPVILPPLVALWRSK